jgi:hypothetical protein
VAQLRFGLLAAGEQAVCYEISWLAGQTHERYVLKVLRPRYRSATHDTVAHEYRSLSVLHHELTSVPDVTCPRPVALLSDYRAYLMTLVPGTSIRRSCLRREEESSLDYTLLATRVLNGLRAYYRATGECYGDFHAGNVLVSEPDHEIALIDPCMANPLYYEPMRWARSAPLSVDLGYWAFHECGRAWRESLTSPPGVARKLGFTRTLIALADGASPEDVPEHVREVVRWHAERFRRSPSVRLSAASVIANYVARYGCGL